MSTLKYWLWLTTRRGLGTLTAYRLLEQFGTPENAYFADGGEYDRVTSLSHRAKQSLMETDLSEAEAILADCDRLGFRLLTLQDAEYPDRLRHISDPPLVLYVRGKLPPVDEHLVLSVVGSRRPTPYGEKMAAAIAMDLARAGAMLCTGIAPGIDSVAIRGALAAGGCVLSVLAGGLDQYQGGSDRRLYDDIAAVGALISEYPPGTPHAADHYRPRNRIISGLSEGVVVVEGGEASGTRITARAALDQGREVFAVPGGADAPQSVTPNRLIHDGEAQLVRSARDILETFTGRYALTVEQPDLEEGAREERLDAVLAPGESAPPPKRQPKPPRPEPQALEEGKLGELGDDQRDILMALQGKTLHPDELVEQTQIPARRVLSALTLLQMRGYIQEETGKRFTALVRLK